MYFTKSKRIIKRRTILLLMVLLMVKGAWLFWMWQHSDDISPDLILEDRKLPLIFISGIPNTGLTLMRKMLNAHKDILCGHSTIVVTSVLQLMQQEDHEEKRLQTAGVSKIVLGNAIASFFLYVIGSHGTAPRFCYSDPLILDMISDVLDLFPNAKFLFMVRDGRAAVHSIMTRNVKVSGCDLRSFQQCLTFWNTSVGRMYQHCKAMSDKCLMVRFEALFLQPDKTLREILAFLNLPWDIAVLKEKPVIDESTTDSIFNSNPIRQLLRSLYLDSVDNWVGQIPSDVLGNIADLAPMLPTLGYDLEANPPRYDLLEPVIHV